MWPFKNKQKAVAFALPLPTPVPPVASPVIVLDPQLRIPTLGEKVWWAPKELECTITSIGKLGFTFQGGEAVKDSKGRLVPRWRVCTGFEHKFDEATGYWIVGQGKTPKNVRGTVITPEPAKIDLSAYLPRAR